MSTISDPCSGAALPQIHTYVQALDPAVHLSVRSCGDRGRPVLLFLHGFPEAAFIWDEYLVHFAARGYRCLAPNLRGFEKSYSPDEVKQYRMERVAQDIVTFIQSEVGAQGQLACLIAHDWGGAVAWRVANEASAHLHKLFIINSPHPGIFLRELQTNPEQQKASAYMNALSRPDAEHLLAQNDYARLLGVFSHASGGQRGKPEWLTRSLEARYRAVWDSGLRGGCNYYRASALKPANGLEADVAETARQSLAAMQLPHARLTVEIPTYVLWGMEDMALLPTLLDGLQIYVSSLLVERVHKASHWLTHEQPALVKQRIAQFIA